MNTPAMTRVGELQADIAIWGWNRESARELERALHDADLKSGASWEHSGAVATRPAPELRRALIEARGASVWSWEQGSGA